MIGLGTYDTKKSGGNGRSGTSSSAKKTGELVGSLQQRYRTCGKPNCKCASGRQEDRHGPHYTRVFYVDGERRREYVRLEDVDQVREKIERRQRRLRIERAERDRHMRRGEGGGRGGRNAYQKFLDGQLEREKEETQHKTYAEALGEKLELLSVLMDR